MLRIKLLQPERKDVNEKSESVRPYKDLKPPQAAEAELTVKRWGRLG